MNNNDDRRRLGHGPAALPAEPRGHRHRSGAGPHADAHPEGGAPFPRPRALPGEAGQRLAEDARGRRHGLPQQGNY